MSATDYLRLNEHKIFKELVESLPKNIEKTLNLITVHDNVLFTWDFQNNCVLSLNIKAARSKEGDNVIHQKLLPLRPPLFSTEFLIVNDIGSLIAVAGSGGVLVLKLPSMCPPYGAFDNNKEVVYCRTYSLDERLLSCSNTVELRQAKFHPGSVNHNHILILTSDNMLRLYQINDEEALNIAVYSIGEKPGTLFPGSKTPFLDIYGEVAVDFDFGHPRIINVPNNNKKEESLILSNRIKNEEKYMINAETQTIDKIIPKKVKEKEKNEKKWDNLVWPVFILRSDMSVYYIEIDLNKRWKPILQGPLPLASFENKQNEACSLIIINTVPQIMCIAFSNGTICHSVLLPVEKDTLDETKDYQKSINQIPAYELLVFESVELELGLATCEEDLDAKYKCSVLLKNDDSKPGRYYATHSAGVHSVVISSVDNLQQFINGPEGIDSLTDIFTNPSKAEYLVCTKTATSEKHNPVIGFALYYLPTSIIALLGDGSLVTLGVLLPGTLPNIEYLAISDEGAVSPLKKMLQEPFEEFIGKILKKTSTQPVLKLPSKNDSSQEECYDLLQRTAQVFRNDYFKNHLRAKEELDKRIQTLNIMKKNQQKEIELIKKERDILREKASNLAEKYEDIKDKQDELSKKTENLLMLVSRKKSKPSETEQAFMKELEQSAEKIGVYGDKIDEIKKKMTYQQIQMENWKSQNNKQMAAINETHINTIKSNLENTTSKFLDMIKQINEIKKYLDLK